MPGPASSLPADAVARVLDRAIAERGAQPEVIMIDNGTEFTSRHFDNWAHVRGIRLDFIRPGKPVENGYVESFNGKYRAGRVVAGARNRSQAAVRLPARSPNLNAFAERFVLSIKSECLDQLVPMGERHLRRAVSEFVAHYHRERNHQGLKNRLIEAPAPSNTNGRIVRRERLGGLLRFYERAAA